jgi:hypothetical protein
MRTLAATILALVGIAFAAAGTPAQSCTTATCAATDCTQANLLAALPSSGNSNSTVVVNIPACSGGTPWTGELSYTIPSAVTNLTIQGQTAINCTGTPGTSSYACSAADNTVIEDSYQNGNPLGIIYTGSSSTYLRITDITFEGGNIGSTNNTKWNGIFQFQGSAQLRVDHCHFNHETYSPANQGGWLRLYGAITGVADHDLWDTATSAFGPNDVYVYTSIGDNIGFADGTWAAPTNWGSSAFFFLESSVFNGGVPDDCGDGGRVVERYNSIYFTYIAGQDHATDSGGLGRSRGCRAFEFYHNYLYGPNNAQDAGFFLTGATGVVWDNNMPSGFTRLIHFNDDRASTAYTETPTPSGWGYCGTDEHGTGSNWDGNNNATTGWPCFDGVGRGMTTQALNGQDFPNVLNSITGTMAWPQQYLEPIYEWGDTVYAGAVIQITGDNASENNRDFYVQTSGFNGTSGTGQGLLSARPSTCTPGPGGTYATSPTGSYGVAYFATDANSGNGELYACTATNTWTAIYQPYTYPHPLEANAGPVSDNTPAPPTGLTASVQ